MSINALDRKRNRWFLYRNPTPQKIEILFDSPLGDFEELTEDCDKLPYYFYDISPIWYANVHNAKIAYVDDFADMLKTVKMMAKWKRNHS